MKLRLIKYRLMLFAFVKMLGMEVSVDVLTTKECMREIEMKGTRGSRIHITDSLSENSASFNPN